ncbi:MAG: class I SAM-dependent methyltransferase [Verrucomicrobiota bacterium]
MKENVFQAYSAYYDLLYRDKDYSKETGYVCKSLRSINPDVKTVLEFGSGTGKHGRLLAQQGFQVTGIELSETMVASAQSIAPDPEDSTQGSFECITGDVRTAGFDRTFDAVISLFHVVSYQTTNEDLRATFSNAARHLKRGGQFFFDVWHGPSVLRERPAVRVKILEDENIRVRRIAEPKLDTNQSVVTVHYTMLIESKDNQNLTAFEEEHRMRYLFPTEIALLAERTGFEVRRAEEFVTGKTPDESTWGVAYLLVKTA